MTDLPAPPPAHEGLLEAYERLLPAFLAVPDNQRQALNVDVPDAATRILGLSPRFEVYRSRLLTLPGFQAAWLDDLPSLARAVLWAYASAPKRRRPSALGPLVAEALALRQRFVVCWRAAASVDHVDAGFLERLSGGSRHVGLAMDLLALAGATQDRWDELAGRTPLTLELAAHAASVGETLLTEAGRRQGRLDDEEGAASRDVLARAFTLLARTYDEVREGVRYLERHLPADQRDAAAPSLRPGRRGSIGHRKHKRKAESDEGNVAPLPAGSQTVRHELTSSSEAP
jgi:hypothetical protein